MSRLLIMQARSGFVVVDEAACDKANLAPEEIVEFAWSFSDAEHLADFVRRWAKGDLEITG